MHQSYERMTSQLRDDIAKAFGAAEDCIKAYTLGDKDLAGAVLRWIDRHARFVAANPDIREAHRTLMKRLEKMALICEASGNVNPQSVATVRSHALAALNDLQTAIYAHGRASETADRVGSGKLGQPI